MKRPKRRAKARMNLQVKAFNLFCKGYSVFAVAEELGITIHQSRKHYELFRQSEEIPLEHKREIDAFIEESWRKDREDALELLSRELSEKNHRKELIKATDECVKVVLEAVPAVGEVVILYGSFSQPFHWMRNQGESRLIDIIKKLCFN